MTGLKRFRQMGGKTVGTDDASQIKERRRVAKSDFVRFATYPVTGSSVVYDLINSPTFGHGLAGNLHGAADVALVGAVGILNWVYGSKLASSSVHADGKYYGSTLWEPGTSKGRSMDYGAYGSFSSGSIMLVWASALKGLEFDSVGGVLNTSSMLIRAGGNIGQTAGVWTERLNPRFIDKHQKGYAGFDWAITTAQSLAVIGSAAAPVILML
jgi:hypothetical protein